jgi:hypothetical protein
MDVLAGIAEVIRIWIEGGSWADVTAAHGFQAVVSFAAFAVPSTLIALGIGMTEWYETPLGMWFGARPQEDEHWAERARDLDKDGLPDF